ncbi:Ldh family oxidoreductase [Candidatus Bathyarchaeota archaeon]|nr:Ldh family oxidoreductase [Candidatus Bathyarchaeota archaeon]
MAVINIRNFLPVQEFKRKVDLLFEAVKGSPAVKGAEIFIPGEPEWRAEGKRRKEEIFVSEETWKRIKKIAQKLGVNILV